MKLRKFIGVLAFCSSMVALGGGSVYAMKCKGKALGKTDVLAIRLDDEQLTNEEWIKVNCEFDEKREECIIKEGVIKIKQGVFRSNKSLKSLKIPSSVRHGYKNEFEHCENSENLEYDGSLKCICLDWVSNCTKLKTVRINGDIGKIEKGAFENCGELSQFVVEGNVISIDKDAFKGCSKLRNFISHKDVKEIKDGAFGFNNPDDVRVFIHSDFKDSHPGNKIGPYSIVTKDSRNISELK